MRVAVVGTGFAGLAVGWYLLQKGIAVDFFEKEPGASAIAAGLMHPYPGEKARRSWMADAAMEASWELFKIAGDVVSAPGIIRYALDPIQQEHLIRRCADFDDIERIDENAFLIKSGVTVFSGRYLEGLRKACQSQGAHFFECDLENIPQDYDQVVLACGTGLIPIQSGWKGVKGQVLKCRIKPGLLTQSVVGKGYVALGETPDICYVGSTFERGVYDTVADSAYAKQELFPKIALFCKAVEEMEVLECRAAIRVTREGSHLPFFDQIANKTWVIGAFGSRGLLYHAFFAKQLCDRLVYTS